MISSFHQWVVQIYEDLKLDPPVSSPVLLSQPRLLDQVRGKIRLKHYSLRTEQAYVDWIKRFIRHNGKRHPREMGAVEVEAFLTHLAVAGRVAASTQNQAKSALLFLYREVLALELPWLDNVQQARGPRRLPVVLTRDEVQALLCRLQGTHWLVASLLYGTGMRIMECLRLRVKDVDFGRCEILVRDGKGFKDRVTMLPATLAAPLRDHLVQVKALHDRDLGNGGGETGLPYALDRKYPGAGRQWCWQYVFPSASLSTDPRSGAVRHETAHELDTGQGNQALAALIIGARPERHRLGTARPFGRVNRYDLHPRAQPRRPWRCQPARPGAPRRCAVHMRGPNCHNARCVYNATYSYTSGRRAMRTNIVIDDALMQAALKATGLATKREAVELALRSLVRLKAQEAIRKYRGKIDLEGDLEAWRRAR